MGLSMTPSGILMTNSAGQTRLNTSIKMFRPLNLVSGSISAATLGTYAQTNTGSSETNTDTENTHTLASISSNATTVRGMAKFSASLMGFSADYTYNAGGSIVFNWSGGGFVSLGSVYCGNRGLVSCRVFTFYCESGSLKLSDRIISVAEYPQCFGAGTNTRTMVAPTITYKVLCGTLQ